MDSKLNLKVSYNNIRSKRIRFIGTVVFFLLAVSAAPQVFADPQPESSASPDPLGALLPQQVILAEPLVPQAASKPSRKKEVPKAAAPEAAPAVREEAESFKPETIVEVMAIETGLAKNCFRILSYIGSVEVRPSPQSEWAEAGVNGRLCKDAEIRTGEDGQADIVYGAGVEIFLQIKSDTVGTVVSGSPPELRLQSGKVLSLVRGLKPGLIFKISSPTAIASVRGTGWEQTVREVKVYEGSVNVKTISGKSNIISKNKWVSIGEDGALSKPLDILPSETGDWNRFLESAERIRTKIFGISTEKKEGAAAAAKEEPDEKIKENEPFEILGVKAGRPEDVTYYNVRSRRSDVVVAGKQLVGTDCVLCASDGSSITAKPVDKPMSKARKIEGPVTGLLSELYYSGALVARKRETVIAVQEGAVQTSTIVKIDGKEVITSTVLLKAPHKQVIEEQLKETESQVKKMKRLSKDLPPAQVQQPVTKTVNPNEPNVMVINACGYVKTLFVPNLDLTANCAENIRLEMSGKTVQKAVSDQCGEKGPVVEAAPSPDPLL